MAQAGLGLLRLVWRRPWTGWMTARAGSTERGWRGPRPRRQALRLRRTAARLRGLTARPPPRRRGIRSNQGADRHASRAPNMGQAPALTITGEALGQRP